ncbi:4Fe-4S dicluster domain-containing protein [Desulfosporosinus fructosivorans]|uniref:4Fe-4S dicluster domain-containing protein n=1 Tax=Desulfosporosinus fructosivorans TaxID=2018669 RepID=A0A4Z0R9G8_9FIRM|nr:LUD domain-containing protein [Desulfosporosinus fructosivorans]TGE39468.1 4Fe-4S dicluster domain-containing protein [Desulfosporosinus fructosivorans]
MGDHTYKIVKNKVTEGLQDMESRKGRFRAFDAIRPAMLKMVPNYPELSDRLRKIKKYSMDHMDEVIAKAQRSLEGKGCTVYLAETVDDAQRYIASLIPNEGLVVKSKSNAGKEINISHYLEDRGVTVVETDLGDRINQLAKCEASHSLAPAIHIPIETITELFSEEAGTTLECTPEALVVSARKGLRNFLVKADVGISGANAIAADTGSIFVTENEGNIRAVSMMPKVHIVIAGVEKIVSTLEDAMQVVRAAAVFGVGQDIGTYVSVISGVSESLDPDLEEYSHGQGPKEVHIVLLKNGRKEAIDAGFKESLYCINCGSCLNFCPVYAEVGAKYGYKYLGGRGLVFAAFHGDLEKSEENGLSLCIGCQRCQSACPVQMATPAMLWKLRQDAVSKKGLGWKKDLVFSMLTKPQTLPVVSRLATTFGKLALKESGKGMTSRLTFNSLGLPQERVIPRFSDKSFTKIAKPKMIAKPIKKVGFYPGCVVNYTETDLGEALLHVLGENNVEVKLAKEDVCCGIPSVVSGDLDHAKTMALKNIEIYSSFDIDALVFVCPSCAVAFKEEYPKLFAEDSPELQEKVKKLALKVKDINEFLIQDIELKPPKQIVTETVTYHDPCHLARSMGVKKEPRELIQKIPGLKYVEMQDADTCCGFGGSFSLSFYELSQRINEGKLKNVADTEATTLATSCPGCMVHFRDGIAQHKMKQKVSHVIQILSRAYGRR